MTTSTTLLLLATVALLGSAALYVWARNALALLEQEPIALDGSEFLHFER